MVKKIKGKELKPPSGFVAKLAAKFLDVAEWFFYKFSIVGDQPVFDNAKFPWVGEIEAEFPKIRAELDRVMQRRDELPNFQDISTDVKTIQTDNNWKTFAFCGYGVWANENCRQCPDTVAA
ncbi:MAG: aspartyl/asparaginyl beta-hydroxylase domain-containing protein, partial [Opitutaceae bacterium]